MNIITIEKSAIDRFCKSWPCHGFPASIDLIVFALADNGDLVDLELCDENNVVIEDNEYDGGAMLAILNDAEHNAITVARAPDMIDCGKVYK